MQIDKIQSNAMIALFILKKWNTNMKMFSYVLTVINTFVYQINMITIRFLFFDYYKLFLLLNIILIVCHFSKMKATLVLALLFLATTFANQLKDTRYPASELEVHIWPQPKSIKTGETTILVDRESFKFNILTEHKDLTDAVERYFNSIITLFTLL